MTDEHEHACRDCGRVKKCDNPWCSHESFRVDLCNECAGNRVMEYNVAPLEMIEKVAGYRMTGVYVDAPLEDGRAI